MIMQTDKWMVVACLGFGVILPAHAAKMNMPKEGPYELRFCTIGQGGGATATEQASVYHYSGVATLSATVPGAAFDRQSARCWGTLGVVNGKASHLGYCEMVDADGDKWLMAYRGREDNSGGTYTAVSGTGKYDGMTLEGQYDLDSWPGLSADGYAGCHKNKGRYKLK